MWTRLHLVAAAGLLVLLAGCGAPPTYSLEKSRSCLAKAGFAISDPKSDFVAQSATVGSFRARFPSRGVNAVTVSFGENGDEAKQTAQGYVRFHARNVGVFDILEVEKNAVLLWKQHPTDAERTEVTSCLK